MKRFVITEEEKKSILGKYYPNNLVVEQTLSQVFGSSVQNISNALSDEGYNTLDKLFSTVLRNSENLVQKDSEYYLKSASGMEIPFKTIKEVIELVCQGKVQKDDVMKYLPRVTADGTEFRNVVSSSLDLKRKTEDSSQSENDELSSFELKHLLRNCFNSGYCDTKNILEDFYKKLEGVKKLNQFDPSKVKVLERVNVAGREIIDVMLEDGTNVLFYKSTGSNLASTGKKMGEWFVIPGFAEDGWFFKTQGTINLTKGGINYLTEMADFLKNNGVEGLG